jgi:hypothetical protein
VRVEVRQPNRCKRFLENDSDGTGTTPVLAVQSRRYEPQVSAHRNLGSRKERIVETPKFLCPQVGHPISHHRSDFVAHWEEGSDERLRELGSHLARVLIDPAFGDIDVPELERGNRAVARAGQDRKRNQCAVPALDIRGRRDGLNDMANLLQGRNSRWAGRLGDPRLSARLEPLLQIGWAIHDPPAQLAVDRTVAIEPQLGERAFGQSNKAGGELSSNDLWHVCHGKAFRSKSGNRDALSSG